MILYDSSVWLEGLSSTSRIDLIRFKKYISDGEVVTLQPIAAEVFARPKTSADTLVLVDAFRGLHRVDPDWNAEETWDALQEIATFACKRRHSPAGLVDRMVVYSAMRARAKLWCLDGKALKLAKLMKVRCEQ